MTTVERYIRRMCEETKGRIETETATARQKLPAREIRMDEAPKRVRALVNANCLAASRVYETYTELDKLGFSAPNTGYRHQKRPAPVKVNRSHRSIEKLIEKLNATRLHRISAVEKLRTDTMIACLGMPPAESKRLIEKLGRDLAAV